MITLSRVLLKKAQDRLFYYVFGLDKQALSRVFQENEAISEILSNVIADLMLTKDSLTQVYQMTGGPGWSETIQQALSHLDSRIDEVRDAVIQHQQIFNQMSDEAEGFVVDDTTHLDWN